jgi:hypothetical protein
VTGQLLTDLLVDGKGVYVVSVEDETGLGEVMITAFRE